MHTPLGYCLLDHTPICIILLEYEISILIADTSASTDVVLLSSANKPSDISVWISWIIISTKTSIWQYYSTRDFKSLTKWFILWPWLVSYRSNQNNFTFNYYVQNGHWTRNRTKKWKLIYCQDNFKLKAIGIAEFIIYPLYMQIYIEIKSRY